ncbi:AbrB/MazE/SpoVT family DNA-binding domain-containing protein [Cesiribacter andamanensis]|uniref:Growth regulator n=1 Tax=Cesiribacter andamanensis AMV16 TaxID=1279009 RepID=M7NSN0_9BACT|nr:AbrB/MazE/SpoVT family DNA-binding domain-containing protein [Cesiribacter andamanensis]EMR01504.1 Growth regulator [Cesiribacter andamanensis AMV16]
MEQPIIRIGNSKGLRLSKSILDRYQIKDRVEVILEEGQIVLKPVSTPREGWDKAFKQMHKRGDDQLLLDDVFDEENFDQWD